MPSHFDSPLSEKFHKSEGKIAAPAPIATGKAQVLYDGQCALCCRSVNLLKELDWLARLAYVDVRRPEDVPRRDPPLEPSRLLLEMHLVPPDGSRVFTGFRAFRWIAWRLPALWLVAPLLCLPGTESLGQRIYLWVARNRFQLIPCHGGICRIPSPKSKIQSPKSEMAQDADPTGE